MDKPIVFERGDRVYLVGPVAMYDPSDGELEELAFAKAVREMAPNENIGWLRGQYVEAERANQNGQFWSTETLAIASLTPMFMPVTVMHDPRTAVGLIADVELVTPEKTPGTTHARIDTTLGVWKHRFPAVWEEVAENYNAGSLMQSMEAKPVFYDCGDCGRRFPKLPGGAEKANWCAHLRGEENTRAVRRLGNVTFTGTGLIFGSRGAKGADSKASLELFQDEVAEFHERAQHDRAHRRTRHMDMIEIQRSEYDSLKADAAKVADLTARAAKLDEETARAADAERAAEKLETEKVAAEQRAADAEAKVTQFEEQARAATLAKDRLGKLGAGFTGKLGERTKARLEQQAASLNDEAWDERLEELAELTGVQVAEGAAAGETAEGVFSREEIARSQAGAGTGNGGGGAEPSQSLRRSVMSGLVKARGK